jgi:hypothetical protein
MPNSPAIVAKTIASITLATHMAGIVGNLRRRGKEAFRKLLALNARSATPPRTCEPSRRIEVLANFGADLPLRELVSRL